MNDCNVNNRSKDSTIIKPDDKTESQLILRKINDPISLLLVPGFWLLFTINTALTTIVEFLSP